MCVCVCVVLEHPKCPGSVMDWKQDVPHLYQQNCVRTHPVWDLTLISSENMVPSVYLSSTNSCLLNFSNFALLC